MVRGMAQGGREGAAAGTAIQQRRGGVGEGAGAEAGGLDAGGRWVVEGGIAWSGEGERVG